MRPTDSRKTRSPHGFTLVEIMAATGIMLVVILLVLTLTTNVLSSWTRSTGQLQTNFEARVAMDLLTSDLESMVVRNRNICWLQVEYQNSVGEIPTGDSPILYLFAPALERPRKKGVGPTAPDILGDVCAISYRQAFKNPFTDSTTKGTPPPPVYGLYRSVVDSENTFNDALALPTFNPADLNNTALSGYWGGTAISGAKTYNESGSEVDINETWITDSSNFLSQNVIQFKLVFWYQQTSTTGGTTTTNTYSITTNPGDATTDPVPFIYAGSGLYLGGSTTPVSGARLVYVDVTLTILDKEYAEQLNRGTLTYAEALEQGQTFSRRINLMSSPL